MHLMHHNYSQVTIIYYMCLCACMCVYVHVLLCLVQLFRDWNNLLISVNEGPIATYWVNHQEGVLIIASWKKLHV